MPHLLDAPPPSLGVPPSGPAERDYYSITQAAALLGVSRVSIWRWIRAGRLPVWRLGHRTSRIKREDLERLLARTGAAAGAESGLAPRSDSRAETSASE